MRHIHLLVLVLGPWWYGGAFDPARYGLAAVLLVSSALGLWIRGTQSGAAVPAGWLVAWGLIQATLGSSPALTVESTLVMASCLAVIVFWSEEARDERNARRLAYAVLAVCAAQASFGAVQASVAPHTIYGQDLPDARSPFGSFLNHNHFAGLMEMAALLALAMAVGRARRVGSADPATIVLAGLSLALVGAHLASRSRGGLFAILAGGAALPALWRLAYGRRTTRKDGALTAASVVLLIGFGWLAVPAATRAHLATLFYGPGDGSGQYRVAVAAATMSLWREHPIFGSGLGTYQDEVPRFKHSDGLVQTRHAESDVLELLAEGGLVGIGLVAWLALAGLRGFLSRVTVGHDPWRKGLAAGALAAVVSLCAHSLVDFNLRIPSNALVFSALLGMAAAPRSEPRRMSPWIGRTVAALTLVLGLAAGWRMAGALELDHARRAAVPHERLARLDRVLSHHPYLAEAYRERAHARWALARGVAALTTLRLEGAEADLRRALRLRPAWSYAWADLGWVLYMRGDPAGAETTFAKARDLNPADMAIGLSRAELLYRTGRHLEARQELLRIRRYNPAWSEAAADVVWKQWVQKLK